MTIDIKILGQITYPGAMQLMNDLHEKRCLGLIPNTILLLSHPPTITRGRRSQTIDNIEFSRLCSQRGIELHDADRGGLLTYHGPGQIVAYFIIKLAQPFLGGTDMVHGIETLLQDFLKDAYGIESTRKMELPGLWLGEKKFMSVGIRIEKGVSKHGIALNVANDLGAYSFFEPCGMPGSVMTSLSKILNYQIQYDEERSLMQKLVDRMKSEFDENRAQWRWVQFD